MSFWQQPWFRKLCRDVAIALLVSLLSILGYDQTLAGRGGVTPPIPGGTGAETAPLQVLGTGKTTNLHALSLAGDLTVGEDILLTAATPISATEGLALQPVGAYQPLQSATSVTVTLALTGAMTGELVLLAHTSPTTLTISGTLASRLAGNAPLTQYSALLLLFDGTRWIELARSVK